MPVGSNILAGASGQATGYEIDSSLLFPENFTDNQDYLAYSPSNANGDQNWTFSIWIKPAYSDLGTQGAGGDSMGILTCGYANRGHMKLSDYRGGTIHTQENQSWNSDMYSAGTYRDPGAWMHILFTWDRNGSTDNTRRMVYVNGQDITPDMTGSKPSSTGLNTIINTQETMLLGASRAYQGGGGGGWFIRNWFTGRMAEIHFVDGQALTPSDFLDIDGSIIKPIEYKGSHGDNGFYLKFDDASNYGADSSGNGNDWTVSGSDFSSSPDTPTNNFATLNHLDPAANHGTSTFKEGNLRIDLSGGNYKYSAVGNGAMSTGKWYFEFCAINSDNSQMLGVADITKGLNRGYTGSSGDGLYIYVDGDKYSPTSSSSYGVSWTYGDVMGIAVDMDNNAMYFAKNNTWMNSGDPTSGSSKTGAAYTTELSGKTWVAAMGRGGLSGTNSGTFNFGQDSSFAGAKTAQGNQDGNGIGDFYYTPPSGYLALCSQNLPDPSIADPTKHFNTVLYTGNGSTGHAISGVGFQPDFVWVKSRSDSGTNHGLHDSIRVIGGNEEVLFSNTTNAGSTGSAYLSSFDSDGFTLNNNTSGNNSGSTFASWNWKAGGTASSNTDGSITSSISANTDAGFSIVAWTGTGSNVTVGHGLSQAPELIINKSRDDAYNWAVQSILFNSASDTNILYLNTTAAQADDTNVFQAAPTATVFSPQGGSWAGIGASGVDYIAYCFHSVDGYSKVGKYTGNSNADGPMFYCGFKPAWAMFKATGSAQSWTVFDNKRNVYNLMDNSLFPDLSNEENDATSLSIDFVSNGIKIRSTHNYVNYSGSDYLVLAFAESPFKTSNAR